MEKLRNYIKNQFIYEYINNIDAKIINESLEASVLRDVAKQLLTLQKTEKEKMEKERAEKGYYYGWTRNQNFRKIFAENEYVEWDKIKDSDVMEIEPTDTLDVKTTKKNEKLVREILKAKKPGIIISYNDETKKFEYVIFTYRGMYSLNDSNYYNSYAGDSQKNKIGRQWKYISDKDKLGLIKGKRLYIIYTDVLRKELTDKRFNRRQEKNGMVLLDPDSLKRIAEENIKRYKQILKEKRASEVNNDKLLDEAGELINKVSEYCIKIAKDPISNADRISDASVLSQWIYDKRKYVNGTSRRNPGYYSGKNGLLPMIISYMQNLEEVQKGSSYDWYERDYKIAQQEIKKAIDEIKKYCTNKGITL